MKIEHIPVMREEVLDNLKLENAGIYVDATVGLGGHAEGIAERTGGDCTLIGIDRDERAINLARERLSGYGHVHLVQERFSNMSDVVKSLGFEKVNGILLDIGVSTLHLKEEGRGFSFLRDEPLDMRMDRSIELTAEKVVNTYSEKVLADVIWRFGEERYSRRIARAVVRERKKSRIQSCSELARVVERAIGRRGRIHPATRTFQALRIEVNKELEELNVAIESAVDLLESGGRFCILSYHSLEDRIVKLAFRELAKEGLFSIITRKPMVPGDDEKRANPSSRSAKLRVAEKV